VQGTRESACLNEREINACRAMANALGVDWVTLGTP
jgi:hypothetical protein